VKALCNGLDNVDFSAAQRLLGLSGMGFIDACSKPVINKAKILPTPFSR
jgi:hypothetical protein